MSRPLACCIALVIAACRPFASSAPGDAGSPEDPINGGPGACWSDPSAVVVSFDEPSLFLPQDYGTVEPGNQPDAVKFVLVPKDPPRWLQLQSLSSTFVNADLAFKPLPLTTTASAGTKFRAPAFDSPSGEEIRALDMVVTGGDASDSGVLWAYVTYSPARTTFRLDGQGTSLGMDPAVTPIKPNEWTTVEIRLTVDPPQAALFLDGSRVSAYLAFPGISLANTRVHAEASLEANSTVASFEYDDVCTLAR
jgi:hypothetical protein